MRRDKNRYREAREEQRRAQKGRVQNRAQEERDGEVSAQREREKQVREVKTEEKRREQHREVSEEEKERREMRSRHGRIECADLATGTESVVLGIDVSVPSHT